LPEKDFPHASVVEGLRFTAQVAVPNVMQGLFRRRRTVTAIADAARADRFAVGFVSGLKRSYGEGPLWVRVAAGEALLLLGRDSIRVALEGSPDPFAADPEPKKSGMSRFQPDALTISRNPEWEDRRRFAEAVLDTGKPAHRLADRFAAVCAEEAGALRGQLDWDTWNRVVRRVTRRVVLGDSAAADEAISEMLGQLMDKSNPPGRGDADLYDRYMNALVKYVSAREDGSIVGLFDDAPVTERTQPTGQVTHWLFAMGDTLAINAFRCLAVLAASDAERGRVVEEISAADLASGTGVASLTRLGACLHEAMRLWPTTAMLSRVTAEDAEIDGVTLPAGTQLLIVNTFNHRDQDELDWADRFEPDQWISGEAGGDWLFNHLSHGPQGCPGADLALFVGKAMLGTVLRDHDVRPVQPKLDLTQPLPPSLDFFGIRVEVV
jgi:cytochrome P450